MPRRPRKQPRASNAVNARKYPTAVKKGDATIRKWVRREDIARDDEDNFHEARDRIMLEGDEGEGEDWDDGEEEVFGLGLEEVSSVDGEDGEVYGDVEPAAIDDIRKRTNAKAKKSSLQPRPLSSSDSEESESWGRTESAYYASNAPLLQGKAGEEDEDEVNDMEEREARRLQARMRESMVDEDYGLDDVADVGAEEVFLEDEHASKNLEVAPVSGVHLDKAAALRQLEKTSPETLALAREWDDVARELIRVQERLDELESASPDALALGVSHLHHQTLLTYVTTLAFYLHLRAAIPLASSVSQTQQSPRLKVVLMRLVTLKQALATMEELDLDASDDDEWDSDVSDLSEEGLAGLGRLTGGGREDMRELRRRGRKPLEEGELEGLLKDAEAENNGRLKKRVRKEKDASPNKESPAVFNGVDGQESTLGYTFDLVEPDFIQTTGSTALGTGDGLEAYGEVIALSVTDGADKKARKRTLRFHTSKIEHSARKKEEGRQRMNGDDDIPYRERKKEKEARVRREMEKTRGGSGSDLDPEGDMGVDDAIDNSALGKRKRDEEDGYYELVRKTKQEKKESLKRQYEDTRSAERRDFADHELASGPRSLTRAILKNKGLTPRRSKSVRNPRVKKRERFEKAKKKMGSQKAVFKGGLAGRPYGGEESGITKVVKSIKL